ncbi:cytochrome P450 [Artomyces pyxidatus]|uniref:Cytochrome P450 n=1 Tax=Artomyces pyxidatus TaxID=48021 RepID=A0ACB8SK84_9AGAM|nr:cytochrome P450 [Artomyces pyxidatus]
MSLDGLRDLSWLILSLSLFSAAALASVATILSFLIRRFKQISVWKIPGPPSISYMSGNYSQMFHAGASEFHAHLNRTYGRVVRITGLLSDAELVISDARACASILVKDQDNFEVIEWFMEEAFRGSSHRLLSLKGAHHRKLRKQLNPVFAPKHLRAMVPLFHTVAQQLREVLENKVAHGPQEIDLLNWLSRLSLEMILQGGLGHTFDSLNPDGGESEFGKAIKEFTPTMTRLIAFCMFFPLVSRWPSWILRFGAKLMPFPMIHNIIRVTDTIDKHAREIFDHKKALLKSGEQQFAQQISHGKDLISVLMKSNSDASDDERFTDEEIMGQMASLSFAATDTTSTALARIFFMLAQHPDAQEKLRHELDDALAVSGANSLGYDELGDLPYLDAVCKETLRMFPPLNFAHRVCLADTAVPLSQAVHTAEGPMDTLVIPRGTAVHVNIIGLNRDPYIWGADGNEWKPERWLAPLPGSVLAARIPGVYANTLTFVGGSRSCIGFKFSELEMKVVLSQLVPAFRFSLSQTEVIWRFGGITSPTVKGSDAVGPSMPLVLQKV